MIKKIIQINFLIIEYLQPVLEVGGGAWGDGAPLQFYFYFCAHQPLFLNCGGGGERYRNYT